MRAVTPLIDMAMMRLPAVWTNNLVALLIGVGMYATFAFLPEMVQTPRSAGYGFGASITQSGLMLLPWSVLMFGTGQFTGRLLLRFGGKALVVSGCLIGAASLAMLAFAHAAEWEIYLADSLMGIGFGLAFPAMAALIVDAVPASQTGVASGMNANVRTIGGSIGSALMASIVTARLLPSGLPREAGYTGGFAAMTAALLLAAAAGLLIPAVRRAASAASAGAVVDAAAAAASLGGAVPRARRWPRPSRPAGGIRVRVGSACGRTAGRGLAAPSCSTASSTRSSCACWRVSTAMYSPEATVDKAGGAVCAGEREQGAEPDPAPALARPAPALATVKVRGELGVRQGAQLRQGEASGPLDVAANGNRDVASHLQRIATVGPVKRDSPAGSAVRRRPGSRPAFRRVLDGGQPVVPGAGGGVEPSGRPGAAERRPQPVANLASSLHRVNKPGIAQRRKVLRHRLAGDRQLLRDRGRGRGAAGAEHADDLAAARVGECDEHSRDGAGRRVEAHAVVPGRAPR